MIHFGVPTIAITTLLAIAAAGPFAACCRGQDAGVGGLQLDTIDAQTRWAFRTRSPVTVHSPIVRLADVVQPLDPNLAAWPRLSRAAIALVPVDGQPMTIRRDRLHRALLQAEATAAVIDWIGPTEIRVEYQPQADADTGNVSPALSSAVASTATPITPTQTVAPRDDLATGGQLAPASYVNTATAANSASLPAADAERVIYWIELAIERMQPATAENFSCQIDPRQPGLIPLQGIAGVTELQPLGPIRAGLCGFRVIGRSSNGPAESDVLVMLTAHPKVVVPRKSLGRGHRIGAGDLELAAMPEQELEPGHYADPQSLVGMEVRTSLRSGRPVMPADVGPPILIHRGELVEIRVVGGGVRVTTNAKALGDGAATDLIEIETLNPRKRLVARVVEPGVVEIITRAPRVSP